MFEMTALSAAILYSTLGLIIGVSVSALFFYCVTYGKIKKKNHQLRDACLLYQKQLTQLLNKNKALEILVREVKKRWERGQVSGNGVSTEPSAMAESDADKAGLSAAETLMQWNEERQIWTKQADELRAELEQLRQEKQVLEDSLQQANERWKHDRSQLQRSNSELEGKVEQLRSGSPGEAGAEAEPVAAEELVAKFDKQRAGWQRAHGLLRGQIAKFKVDRKALETELVAQVHQTEREKQALEDEIELLTDRLLRMQQHELEREIEASMSETPVKGAAFSS